MDKKVYEYMTAREVYRYLGLSRQVFQIHMSDHIKFGECHRKWCVDGMCKVPPYDRGMAEKLSQKIWRREIVEAWKKEMDRRSSAQN